MSRPNVLVIDDQPAMLNLLIEAFEPAGYNVLVALAGEMALTMLQQITPDVILLDAVMPGLDGFEVCRRIKQRPTLALVPVIFMTGLSDTCHIVEGLQAGGVDYVTKPVNPDEVIARVKVHLANAQLTRSAQQAMDVTGRYLLAADSSGRLSWCTQQAALLLQNPSAGDSLPAEATEWLKAKLAYPKQKVPDTVTIAKPRDRLNGQPAPGRIEFALIGQLAGDEHLLRIVEVDIDQDMERLQARVPLTRRETEVLLWLARGKSNRDIAQILDVSFRTVNKHLEQIYPKLGVESRTSAVALTIRILEGG